MTADVPDFARAAGNPARVEGWVCACGQPLTVGTGPDGRVTCVCGRVYELSAAGGLVEAAAPSPYLSPERREESDRPLSHQVCDRL